MSYRPTRQDLENEKPGYCVTCGKWANYRNTGGNCIDCHNKAYFVRRAELTARNQQAKEEGRKAWESIGIKPGDKVRVFALSWCGLGGEEVMGIAKAGSCGAYVSSPYQSGRLDPRGWTKA